MTPASPMRARAPQPGPTGADAVHPLPDEHVVGDAAAGPAAGAGSASASDDAPVDWLGEMHLPGAAGGAAGQSPPKGVPVSTRTRGDHRRGNAVESKRGQR